MRRLDVDRMRRHVARTTPSRIRIETDGLDEAEVRARIDHWMRRMVVKHNDPQPNAELWAHDDPARLVRVIQAKIVPHYY